MRTQDTDLVVHTHTITIISGTAIQHWRLRAHTCTAKQESRDTFKPLTCSWPPRGNTTGHGLESNDFLVHSRDTGALKHTGYEWHLRSTRSDWDRLPTQRSVAVKQRSLLRRLQQYNSIFTTRPRRKVLDRSHSYIHIHTHTQIVPQEGNLKIINAILGKRRIMVINHFLSNTDDEVVCGVKEMLVQKEEKTQKVKKSICHRKYGFGWFSKMRYKIMPVNKNKTKQNNKIKNQNAHFQWEKNL